MRPKPSRPRTAVTLLELMAALALATLLMTAVLGVLRSLATQKRALLEKRPPAAWQGQLLEQLRWDLANARRMRVDPESLHLVGYGSRDFATGETTHRPAEVIYAIEADDRFPRLVRREVHLDSAARDNHRSELVCLGVTALSVRRWPDTGNDGRPTPRTGRPTPTPLGPVPDRLRLVLHGVEDNQTILDQVIFLR